MKSLYLIAACLLLVTLQAQRHSLTTHFFDTKEDDIITGQILGARIMQQNTPQFPATQNIPAFGESRSAPELSFGTFQTAEQSQNAILQKANQPNQQQQTQQTEQTGAQTVNSGSTSSTQTAARTVAPNLQPAKQEPPKILISEVGKPVLGTSFRVDNGVSYQRLSLKEVQLKYLFIDFKLGQSDSWQQANLTISIEGTSNVLKTCNYDGYDSCYIPSSMVKPNQVLFVVVHCQDQCKYRLNSRWSDLEHLVPGSQYSFKFGKETFQLYHVELEGIQFQEFRVHIAPRVTNRPFDNVKMYGKWGKNSDPTPEDYDFTSTNLWEDGQGLFLQSSRMKEKNFSLLLVGQQQTTYNLKCQLIKEANHQIQEGEHLYEYLSADESKSYHVEQFDTQKYEEFSLKVSILSGYVQIRYYYDKELTKELPIEPFRYMDDSEYIFDSKQIAQLATTGIYLKATASADPSGQPARASTYTIKFQSRRKAEAVELNQHVYGFIPIQDTRFAYFNFIRWIYQTQKASNLIFTVSMIEVVGQSKPEFFLCQHYNVRLCTSEDSYLNYTKPIPVTDQKLGEVRHYTLEISDQTLKNINLVEKEGNLVVRLNATEKDTNLNFNLVALQMLNKNKVQYLREDRPLQEKLAGNEMKLYKYINSDPNVKEIRVHINQIAGVVKFDGIIKSEDTKKTIAVRPEGHTLRFTTNLTLPIILSVRAQTKAIFGISMQVILANEMHENADVIAIGQDLAYTVRIHPQSYTVFEVTPMFYQFSFRYSSSQSVIVCPLSPETGTCVDFENKTTIPRLSFQGTISNVQMSAERRARVKITNPFPDSTAEVTVIFHSRTIDHCDQKQIGKVYSQTVKNKDCYSYLIQEEQKTGLEIYISKRQFANMQYSVFVCGNSISNAQTVKTITLQPDVLSKYCQYSSSSKKVTILWSVNTSNAGVPDYKVKVDFVVQKTGGLVMLPEGLSYLMSGRAREGVLRIFGYSFINKLDTKVYVRQNIGKFKAYAKVVRDQQRQSEAVSDINYHFTSYTTVDYSQDPVIIIKKEDISKGNCLDCTLLIAVYTEQDPGRTVEFQIEVVQKYSTLKDDGSERGYLEAGSLAYYNYIAKEGDTTLVFFLSDHNQRCANMFLSLTENPGPKNTISSVFETNQLVYHHKGPDLKYFLGVQATQTCDYALSVLQVDSSIHRLERNKQNILKLVKGNTRFFTFQHYTDEPFKIISLSKFGEVQLYLTKSKEAPNKKSWTVDELNVESFEVKSQHPNTLSVNQKDSVYCVNCDYFVAAKATTSTFATIYLVYPQTVVPLLTNKFFSDYLTSVNDQTLASYTRTEKTNLQITVHTGELEVTAVYKDAYRTSQTFKAQAGLQTMQIDITEVLKSQQKSGENKVDPYFQAQKTQALGFKEHIPINFIFRATADSTSYTLEPVIIDQGQGITGFATYRNIKAGEPNHLTITNNQPLCIDGYLRHPTEQILISTNSDNKLQLSNIIFDAKLRDNKTKINAHLTNNVLSISLVDDKPEQVLPYGNNNYEICMKLEVKRTEKTMTDEEKQQLIEMYTIGGNTTGIEEFEDQDKEVELNAVVTQINDVNILPPDIDTTVHGTATYLINSDGEFILDVFQCQGDARVSYSDSLEKIESSKGKLLQSVGISEQRHAVKVVQSEQTFIRVSSDNALVRWLPINYETDEGTGYVKFAAGDLKYSSQFKSIRISFQPLQSIKSTKSQIEKVKYFLYISNNADSLDEASQCQTTPADVFAIPLHEIEFKVDKQTQKDYEYYDMDKNMLESQFNGSDNIYINIVAKLELTLSSKVSKDPRFDTPLSDEHEHYTFIYNRQQMPLETYQPTQIQAIPYHYLLAILLSVVLLLVLATYLFTRKIAPMIARLRSSNLVEERDDPAPRDDLEVVPPSSDRNQRASDLAVETQERMK